MNRDIPALTGLRAIAAGWVLIHHVSHIFQRVGGPAHTLSHYLGAGGFLGVDIFFVLSGFILSHNYAHSGLAGSFRAYGGFLWKRLARIYPVHVAALVLFCIALLVKTAFDLPYGALHLQNSTNLLQNLLLVHAWAIPVTKSWNVAAWSISAEWAAYLVFPLLVVLAARFRSIPATGAVIILLMLALASNVHFSPYGGTMAYGMVRIGTEFPAGVLLHRIWVLSGCRTSPWFDALAVIFALVLLAGGNAIAVTQGSTVALAAMPIFACGFVYCLAGSTAFAKRLMSLPAMLHLGRVSYAFYMVHLISLSMAAAIALQYGLYASAAQTAVILLLAVVLAYACALWFYFSIEHPTRRWMIGLIASRLRVPEGSVAAHGPA